MVSPKNVYLQKVTSYGNIRDMVFLGIPFMVFLGKNLVLHMIKNTERVNSPVNPLILFLGINCFRLYLELKIMPLIEFACDVRISKYLALHFIGTHDTA